jgi:hypothetical protein
MRTIEDIIAEAQSAVAASLREAFDAGRHHQTTEMREKFVAFFEGVIAPFSGAPAAAPAPPAPVAEAAAEAAPAEAMAEAAPAEAPTSAETAPEATAEPASAA